VLSKIRNSPRPSLPALSLSKPIEISVKPPRATAAVLRASSMSSSAHRPAPTDEQPPSRAAATHDRVAHAAAAHGRAASSMCCRRPRPGGLLRAPPPPRRTAGHCRAWLALRAPPPSDSADRRPLPMHHRTRLISHFYRYEILQVLDMNLN
jgi:hypothetical protein